MQQTSSQKENAATCVYKRNYIALQIPLKTSENDSPWHTVATQSEIPKHSLFVVLVKYAVYIIISNFILQWRPVTGSVVLSVFRTSYQNLSDTILYKCTKQKMQERSCLSGKSYM